MLTFICTQLRVEYHHPLARKELNPPEFTPSTREHNHGYPTVDPLKLKMKAIKLGILQITTVIRPWTH